MESQKDIDNSIPEGYKERVKLNDFFKEINEQHIDIEKEYALIQQKKSNFSVSKRELIILIYNKRMELRNSIKEANNAR